MIKETEQKQMANLLEIEEIDLNEANEIILNCDEMEEVNIDCSELFDEKIIYCDTIIIANKEAKIEPQVPILPIEFRGGNERVIIKLPVIIDTGANASIRGTEIFEELKWEMTPTNVKLYGVERETRY